MNSQHRETRIWARGAQLCFAFLLLFFLSFSCLATTLPAAGGAAEAKCGVTLTGRLENRYSGLVKGRYPCGASAYGQCNTHTARGASLVAFGYETGLARVQGSAVTTLDPDCQGVPGGTAYIVLTASVGYSLGFPLITIPPPGFTGQPIPIIVKGSLSGLSEGSTAAYGATMRITGPGVNEAWEANSFGLPNVTINASIYMDVYDSYGVSLLATCNATSGAYGPFDTRCAATADPTFEFDQLTFDEMMGEDTFPLDEYFRIEFSENLIATPVGIDIAKLTNLNRAASPYDANVPRIAEGDAVTWTYEVANTGETPIDAADLVIMDSDPGLVPVLDISSDDGDLILSPMEVWEYSATATALDLTDPPPGTAIIPGCGDGRNTYANTARAEVAGTDIFDEDISYYCNDIAVLDSDSDGIRDEQDNCIMTPNGPLIPDAGGNSQLDTDDDGYGNLCDGDLNNDGATNTLDLNLYKQAHRTSEGDTNYNSDADFNGDAVINTLDLNLYKGLHRKPPGPSCCGLF